MALWKPFRGNRAALDLVEKHDGYVYFCVDDGSLFFDHLDDDGNLQRKQINAKEAEKLIGYDIATILNSSDIEIPTSKAVLEAIEVAKADVVLKDLTVLSEAQAYTNEAIEAVQTELSNQDTVILAEAQAYTDEAIATIPAAPSKTSQLTNDSGFITTETDPTVPAWAKADTKPVYTAEEVGALSADTEIPSIEGLATEDYVDTAVESAKVEAANQDTVILAEAQAYADKVSDDALESVKTDITIKDAMILAEAQDFASQIVADALESAKTDATVRDLAVLSEAQAYTDGAMATISIPTGLPNVTTADNGKVLMVVNGEWQLVNLNLSVDADGVLTVQ